MAKWRYFGSKNHCFYKIKKGTRLKTAQFSQYPFSFSNNINLTETGGTLDFQVDFGTLFHRYAKNSRKWYFWGVSKCAP